MSIPSVFSFEDANVRTIGTPDLPLFVAIDICNALQHSNPRKAIKDLVDPEDLIKAEIETKGGVQTVNCVNESGLYALIFGSKLESAKRFKRWVTSEVLPAIRKTGRYEAPAAPQYITVEQQYAIQSAVAHRVHDAGVSYQVVYRALKSHFKVPKYTYILERDFEAAIAFIKTCELAVPEAKSPQQPAVQDGACPHCGLHPVPPDYVVLTSRQADELLGFIYYVRYLFAPSFNKFYEFLKVANSPLAGNCWDAFHEVNWNGVLSALAANGHDIENLECYQHWRARNAG